MLRREGIIGQLGQTLLEVTAALGIALMIITAVTVAVTSSLRNAQFSKNQSLATQYAQQGMEQLRQLRNSDWTLFSSLSGRYCLPEDSRVLLPSGSGCPKNVAQTFVREVVIERPSSACSDHTRAIVSVSWSDSKCPSTPNSFCHTSKLDSCFSNFNIVPAP